MIHMIYVLIIYVFFITNKLLFVLFCGHRCHWMGTYPWP